MLSHAAYQIFQITAALQVNDTVIENIWSCLKYILTLEFNLLKNHHLDQMILCSIYGVFRVFQIPLKFQDIINKYKNQSF